ncbi:polysaccharide biosynthesis protein [Mangrovimicrobium sediminis]|uniref:Polysaccharide biosynthesis protein n=1 Tax=Mangrovimicrobium sediminis TaxID=2562682 RepID=A0A4Z0M2X5_9GAMM|nr:oligosaccharide flippase family protein [Haliea sp. SAOS-164]TGD73962.1 polysaccharide biosynthesis protein [Haliea sp. SAOS-164]
MQQSSLKQLTLSSAFWTITSLGASQVLRLASNLILTRLLYPEAFGLMALVHAFAYGLQMITDIGAHSSIMQSKNAHNMAFQNTVWTFTVARGFFVFACFCVIAYPVSQAYGEPLLLQILPIVGLNAIVMAFIPTYVAMAQRALNLRRQTILELSSQVLSLLMLVALAYWLRSVWALVIGGLIAELLKLAIFTFCMPGKYNRLHWDPQYFKEVFHFGKWIFLSSSCVFLTNEGDRLILGLNLTTAELGVYSIAYMLAVFPRMFTITVGNRVIFPLCVHSPPAASAQNRARYIKARFAVSFVFVNASLAVAAIGPELIGFLYDARYHDAKLFLMLLALCFIPRIIMATSEGSVLATGDSRRYAAIGTTTAVVQTLLILLSVGYFGVAGVAASFFATSLITYPLVARVTRQHAGWVPWLDVGLLAYSLAVALPILYFRMDWAALLPVQ